MTGLEFQALGFFGLVYVSFWLRGWGGAGWRSQRALYSLQHVLAVFIVLSGTAAVILVISI